MVTRAFPPLILQDESTIISIEKGTRTVLVCLFIQTNKFKFHQHNNKYEIFFNSSVTAVTRTNRPVAAGRTQTDCPAGPWLHFVARPQCAWSQRPAENRNIYGAAPKSSETLTTCRTLRRGCCASPRHPRRRTRTLTRLHTFVQH